MNMLSYLFDIGFVIIVLAIASLVRRRLMVEGALIFLTSLIACLGALSLFEPLANWCIKRLFLDSDMFIANYLWSALAIFLFILVFTLLIQGCLRLLDQPPQYGHHVELFGSWIFGGLTGYTVAAFLLTIMWTLPFPRDLWGMLEPEAQHRRSPLMALAPDYQLLSLAEYVCVPRSALTGAPWMPAGPLVSTDLDQGDWASFPVRYALWREQLTTFPPEFEDDEVEVGEADAESEADAEIVQNSP